MSVLLGVDVGSSSCKVTAIDARGKVVGSGVQSYPTHYPKQGWAEQDPDDWYRAACQAIQACLASGGLEPAAVIGLAVDGPAHNVALLDDRGELVYACIHWSDLRSVQQSEWLEAKFGDRVFELSYQRVNPSWTLTQLLWLKQAEPEVWSRIRRILVTKDYVRHRFTGDYRTDSYDAIGTQLYDVGAGRWSDELCDILGLPVTRLPAVSPADAIAGGILPGAARDTGLRAGTPVAVGSGDTVIEAFGVGVVDPGQCIVKVGTAACVNLVTAEPRPTVQGLTYRHIVDGRWFAITATNSGASTMRWFRDTFLGGQSGRGGEKDVSAYELTGRLAADASAGCEGLLFHPFLMGERSPYWDPRLRAGFIGVSARHGIQHFARAILEGVAFSIRDCFEVVEKLGEPVAELYLTGGGGQSPLWRQIICDVLGWRLTRPAGDAALGSAMLAGVATGVFPDWPEAVSACTRVEGALTPDPHAHELYTEYYDVYRAAVGDLAVHSHRLADLASLPSTVRPSSTE